MAALHSLVLASSLLASAHTGPARHPAGAGLQSSARHVRAGASMGGSHWNAALRGSHWNAALRGSHWNGVTATGSAHSG